MLPRVKEIAIAAGEEIMRVYRAAPAEVTYKADDSPLTAADRAAHNSIVAALENLTPDIPVISEEFQDHGSRLIPDFAKFWLVDPLDGTKEFLKRTGDFTVNIALVENRRPILGVVYVPVQRVIYSADALGAFKQTEHQDPFSIKVRRANPDALCIVASKDHAGPQVELMLERMPGAQIASMGSSLKFCLVAEGKADLYPRFVPTMEWDTAAADCVLSKAGGAIYEIGGGPLEYQKAGLKNGSIIALGDTSLNWERFLL